MKEKVNMIDREQAGLVKATKIISVTLSAMLFFIGIVLIVWSERLGAVLCPLLAVQALLLGGGRILGYFSNDLYRIAYQHDFAVGTFVAIFGVLLLIDPVGSLPYMPSAVLLYVLLDGLFRIQTAMDAYKFGMPYWYVLLICGLLLAIGALVVHFYEDSIHRFLMMGTFLIADAAVSVFVTMYTVRVRSHRKRRELAVLHLHEDHEDKDEK